MTNDKTSTEFSQIHPSGEVRTDSNMRDVGEGILRQVIPDSHGLTQMTTPW